MKIAVWKKKKKKEEGEGKNMNQLLLYNPAERAHPPPGSGYSQR